MVPTNGTRAPTLREFILRFIIMVATGAFISSLSLLAFYRLVVQVTPADQKVLSNYGVPISVVGILIYIALIVAIALPLVRYIMLVQRGEAMEDNYVIQTQDKAINLGYKIAVIASLFYIITNPLIFTIGIINLGWDMGRMIWYGLAGGLICGLFMIPLGFNFGSWIVRPIVDHTTLMIKAEPARQAGRKMGLGFKMLVTFIPIIVALLIYSSFMGYSQTKSIYDDMKKMEATYLSSDELSELVDEVEHRSDPGIRSSEYYENHLGSLKRSYMIFVLVGIGITLLFTVLASIETTRPLKTLEKHSERIKQGNYEEWVRLATNDELGEVGASVNRMKGTIVSQMDRMKELIEKLRDGIREMDSAVNTVLKVSSEQSTGASQQASAATEASAVSEQFLTTADSIARKANSVSESSASTLKACENGERTLQQMHHKFEQMSSQSQAIVETTAGLREMFQRTYEIVKVIEDIADRTELISLNALIEAVGAGASGKRFTIVAEETRKLARYANETVKDIRGLVESMQNTTFQAAEKAGTGAEMTEEGREAVEAVGKSLGSISEMASSTSALVTEITYSTNQQSTVSQQLSQSISEVKDVAAQVEQGAKEIENAVTNLKSFAKSLRETVEAPE